MARIMRVTIPPQRGVIDAHDCEGEEIGGMTISSLLKNIVYVLKQIFLMALKRTVKKVTK